MNNIKFYFTVTYNIKRPDGTILTGTYKAFTTTVTQAIRQAKAVEFIEDSDIISVVKD